MSRIILKNVAIDYPVYGVGAMQLRNAFSLHKQKSKNIYRGVENDIVYVRGLHDINLEFNDGDRVALIGRNGAGKSTLLRLLAGIYLPTRGTMSIEGEVQAILDLNSGMEEEATGRQNILFRARYMGISDADAKRAVDDIIDFAEIESFIDMPIRTYSSGMRLRLAFGITTAFTRDTLVIDEILGVGDAKFQAKASERMNKVFEKAGLVILATHSLSLSESIASRGILLEGGKVLGDGKYSEIVQQYTELDMTDNA